MINRKYLLAASLVVSVTTDLARAATACNDLLQIGLGYLASKPMTRLPRFANPDVVTATLIVGQNMPAAKHYDRFFEQSQPLQGKAVQITDETTREEFMTILRSAVLTSDIIMLNAHSSPFTMSFTTNLRINADLLREALSGIDLRGKMLVLYGCSTGAAHFEERHVLSPDNPNRAMVNGRMPVEAQVLESLFVNTNVEYALGFHAPALSSHVIKMNLLRYLARDGGGQSVEGLFDANNIRALQRRVLAPSHPAAAVP